MKSFIQGASEPKSIKWWAQKRCVGKQHLFSPIKSTLEALPVILVITRVGKILDKVNEEIYSRL